MRRLVPLLLLAAVLGGAPAASAGDVMLTPTGDLLRLVAGEDGLFVTMTLADGTPAGELAVPQTTGVVASFLNVAYDPATGGLHLLWQETGELDARIRIASYVHGAWDGPYTLAGGDGTSAVNPELLLFEHKAVILVPSDDPEAEEPVPVTDTATFLHVVWWSYFESLDDGAAHIASLPLDDLGLVDVGDAAAAAQLSDLLPFGIACPGITNAPALAQPRLMVDPASGLPHVLATDFSQCLFQILAIEYHPSLDPVAKRRRRVVVFRQKRIAPIVRMPSLAAAKVDVGHGLKVLLSWDHEEKIEYITLEETGFTEPKALAIGEHLSRAEALELVRTLTR